MRKNWLKVLKTPNVYFIKSGLDLFLHMYWCEPISFSQQNIKITVTLVHSAHMYTLYSVQFVQNIEKLFVATTKNMHRKDNYYI